MFAYAVKLTPDKAPDGEKTLLTTTPALPEITTFGETKAKAVEQASHAVTVMLDYRMEKGLDIPEPDAKPGGPSAVVPARAAMKVLLYQAMRRRGLDKEAFRKTLNIGKRQMKQLFDVDHETDIEVLDAAMAALGRSYDIADTPRAAPAGAPAQAAE